MVFGLDEKQRSILAYLYSLKDTPESPPDQRLSVGSIAKSLNMTQQEVKNKTKKLVKWNYVGFFIFEGRRYYKILPRGILEMEKGTLKETEVEVSTEKVGVKRKTKEILDKKGEG
jgi:DNA-binding MarR family transcriptional regulator